MVIIYGLYLIIIFAITTVRCTNEVPMLIWNSNSDLLDLHVPGALTKLSTSQLHNEYLKKLALDKKSPFVLFVLPSLSLEDLGWRDSNGNGVFPHIGSQVEKDGSDGFFLPSVNNPIKAFDALETNGYKMTEFTSSNLPSNANNIFLVKMDDVKNDEDRFELLRRHDKTIYETCQLVKEKYGGAICTLTALRKSWIEPEQVFSSRKLLQSNAEDNKQNALSVFYLRDVGMVYTKTPIYLNGTTYNITYKLMPENNATITKQGNAIAVFTNGVNELGQSTEQVRLLFKFTSDNQTWQLESIEFMFKTRTELKGVLKPSIPIQSSIGFSFHTPETVTFEDGKFKLIFNSIQAEFFNGIEHESKFSVVDDTIPFFTIPILSGLLVTSLLITIALLGLSLIFDIKTMDLFDDPKGKTVTINASE